MPSGPKRVIRLSEAQQTMGRLLGSQQTYLNFPQPQHIDPLKPQSIFLKCLCGGFASGKTRVNLQHCLLLSAMFPRNEGMILRYHGKDLEESVIPLFFEVCPESWLKEVQKRGKTGMTVTLANDSKIYFRHLHDSSGAGATKTRRHGANLGWFFISQAEEAEVSHWNSMLGRLRNPKAKIKMALLDANPNGRNWIQKIFFPDYVPLDPKNGVFFRTYHHGNVFGVHVDSEENRESNGGFVADDFFDNLLANYSPDWIERYVHGSLEDFSGKIYREFSRNSVHVIKPFDVSQYRHWEFIGGIDVGGSCPWAVVPVYVDEWGNLIVTDGFDRTTADVGQVVSWIKSVLPWQETRSTFVIDPENPIASVQLSEHGIYCRKAEKAILPGILRMNGYFHCRKVMHNGQEVGIEPPEWFKNTQGDEAVARIHKVGCPRIFVFNTYETFIAEHDSYVWDEKKPNTPKKTATQRWDSTDAIRYVSMCRPEPSELLIGPEQKFGKLREVSPISAREWEALDKRLNARNELKRGAYLREANGDFDASDLPDFRSVKLGYDWN